MRRGLNILIRAFKLGCGTLSPIHTYTYKDTKLLWHFVFDIIVTNDDSVFLPEKKFLKKWQYQLYVQTKLDPYLCEMLMFYGAKAAELLIII